MTYFTANNKSLYFVNLAGSLIGGTTACACHRQVASLRSARQAHAVTQTKRLNGKREQSGVSR